MEKPVLVIGDNLVDIFEDTLVFPGGAAATFNYVVKLGGFDSIKDKVKPTDMSSLVSVIANSSTTIERIENKIIKTPPPQLSYYYYINTLLAFYKRYNPGNHVTLVISDYNKGTLSSLVCNESWREYFSKTIFTCAVFDSRYKSIPKDLLKCSNVNIWHATGPEWDREYGEQFDYTLHTDGPNPIRLRDRWGSVFHTMPVPSDTPVVDTTGAGDCFTASIGTFMSKLEVLGPTKDEIVNAVEFGITNCQEVVATQYTKVPKFLIHIDQWRKLDVHH